MDFLKDAGFVWVLLAFGLGYLVDSNRKENRKERRKDILEMLRQFEKEKNEPLKPADAAELPVLQNEPNKFKDHTFFPM